MLPISAGIHLAESEGGRWGSRRGSARLKKASLHFVVFMVYAAVKPPDSIEAMRHQGQFYG